MPKKIRRVRDLTGLRSGRLTVVRREGSDGCVKGHSTWLCVCDCGGTAIVSSINIQSGNTTSCGCYKREVLAQTLANQAKSGTGPEVIFTRALRRAGVSFDEQYWVTKKKNIMWGSDCFSDFRIKNTNIIVEVDGCYYHNCKECGLEKSFPGKTEADLRRHEFIESLGFDVYHFWEHEIKTDADACVRSLPIVWFS